VGSTGQGIGEGDATPDLIRPCVIVGHPLTGVTSSCARQPGLLLGRGSGVRTLGALGADRERASGGGFRGTGPLGLGLRRASAAQTNGAGPSADGGRLAGGGATRRKETPGEYQAPGDAAGSQPPGGIPGRQPGARTEVGRRLGGGAGPASHSPQTWDAREHTSCVGDPVRSDLGALLTRAGTGVSRVIVASAAFAVPAASGRPDGPLLIHGSSCGPASCHAVAP